MKNYSSPDREGDKGKTSILPSSGIEKDCPLIQSLGTVDELNSIVGVARASSKDLEVNAILKKIQEDLLIVGSDMNNLSRDPNYPFIEKENISYVETVIENFEAQLPPLKHFILPGGTSSASYLHLARSVSRRAEREVVNLAKEQNVNPEILKYLNRLSDMFFVLARIVNFRNQTKEDEWMPRG